MEYARGAGALSRDYGTHARTQAGADHAADLSEDSESFNGIQTEDSEVIEIED
mgnify:CR=1 FL=1